MDIGVGETFAGFVIEGVLGQGGMGTVYAARHPRLPRVVALKLLNREVSADQELRRRFEQEANVVARLDHPGIVGIHDRGTEQGYLWIAMQYVPGIDAARLDPRTLTVERAVRIMAETAAALDYAHSRGVLHRDIKPANILLFAPEAGRAERAVLTDFGIARLLDSNTQLTATGTFTATLAYASPEQLAGEPVDHRSDQYSLACTLYTLLAGRAPFASTNPGQVVAGHLNKPMPPLGRADLPPGLAMVIARAMAKRPDERYSSCGEFAAAATVALHRRPPTMPRPVPSRPPAARLAPTHPGPVHSPPQPAQLRSASAQSASARLAPTRQAPAVEDRDSGPVPQPAPVGGADARPGGAIAIPAAVLALLTGLVATWRTVFWAGQLADVFRWYTAGYDRRNAYLSFIRDAAVPTAGFAAMAVLLTLGGLLLFGRRRAGRVMVLMGAVVGAVFAAYSIVRISDVNQVTVSYAVGAGVCVLLGCAAVSRPVRRWVSGRGRSA